MEKKTDAELVALARSGDKEAFGHLIERYQAMVRYVAMRMVTNEDTAWELAQEAMLQAYLSLHHLRDDARFKSWLYGIVLNVCKNYLRNQKTAFYSLEAMAGGVQFDALPFSSTTPDPQELVEEWELQRSILWAIDDLSQKNKDATYLFYYEKLSLQEIAATLGISVGTVKGRLHRARTQLREWLLPFHPEIGRSIEERRNMIKVTIADIVQQEKYYVIVLLDEAERRILPIWIGETEAQAIAAYYLEHPLSRPCPHDLMANLLEAAGVTLEEVRVEALKEMTFYAVVKLRSEDTTREVDARPSDAIALALRMNSPIYAAEDVLKEAGLDIPEELGPTPRRRGLEKIRDKIEKETRTPQQKLLDIVFGEEAEI